MPTEDAFDPQHGGGYETVLTADSNLEPAAGRAIQDATVRLARALTPGKAPAGERVQPADTVWAFGALGPELD